MTYVFFNILLTGYPQQQKVFFDNFFIKNASFDREVLTLYQRKYNVQSFLGPAGLFLSNLFVFMLFYNVLIFGRSVLI